VEEWRIEIRTGADAALATATAAAWAGLADDLVRRTSLRTL
jgi:hypothetical protein